MSGPARIALLGAESTGKTTLALALVRSLRDAGLRAVLVPEVLREFCAREGRLPQPEDQRGIAQEQARRVLSVTDADLVIADTTPLMTAVYSDRLFADTSLYPFALEHQRVYAATLLAGLDLPWMADGLQRDGPHEQGPVDALVRAALVRGGIGWRMVYGTGEARLGSALQALGPLAGAAVPMLSAPATADWLCLNCDDAACEHRLFTRLKGRLPKG